MNEWYAPAVLNLYKLEFLNRFNLRYQIGIVHEDMEMLPRIYLAANTISYCDYAFYNYEIRDNSIMTSKNNNNKAKHVVGIYSKWKDQFDSINDTVLQRKLYGVLIKHYLHSCRTLGMTGWLVNGLNFRFSIKYALNWKEKAKVIVFQFVPKIYVKMGDI